MKILMRKGVGSLAPVDTAGKQAMAKIGRGKLVTVELKQPRNIKHHRLFFALLNLVFENQDRYDTFDHFRTAFTVALGHCDTVILPGDKVAYTPKSISFAKMGQAEFDRLWDQAVDMVCTQWLPGVTEETLHREVKEMVARDE